jgi:hypothetical protein
MYIYQYLLILHNIFVYLSSYRFQQHRLHMYNVESWDDQWVMNYKR